MGYSTSNKLRSLRIKFDIYSDGEDNEFKSELVSLMKGSVLELQSAAVAAFSIRNADVFKKAAHKAKSTLVLLDDQELIDVVDDFKDRLIECEDQPQSQMNPYKIRKLNEVCESICESLEREADQLRSSC